MPARLFARILLRMAYVAAAGVLAVLSPIRHCQAAGPDYLIDVWDTERDLPNSSVTAIAQTPDGYLWVGTYNGLARFDGVRFVTFDPINTPALGNARVQGLEVDQAGTLWINTYRGGLTSYRNGTFEREWQGRGAFDVRTTLVSASANRLVFATQAGEILVREQQSASTHGAWSTLTTPGGARLSYQCSDPQGRHWLLTRTSQVILLEGSRFTELAEAARPGTNRVILLVADARGGIWAGTDHGIALWDGARFEDMTATNGEPALETEFILPTRDGGLWVLADGRLRKQMGRRWVAEAEAWRGLLGSASFRSMGAHEDRDGGIWLNHYGNGLFHITPDLRYQRFTMREGLPGDRVWAWYQGKEGEIWVGLDRGGLARLREQQFHVIGPAQGLPGRAGLSVCQDSAGAIWFGTSSGGLARWSDDRLQSVPVGSDASENFVFSIAPRQSGGLWLSAGAGEELYEFRDGKLQRAPFEAHGVKALLEDHNGRLWIGTKAGVHWWQSTSSGNYGSRAGMTAAVRALVEDKAGRIWCGADDGALYRCDTEHVEVFRPTDALAAQPVWSLLADDDGTIWAGTFGGGLLRFKDRKFTRLTTANGLPSDVISQVVKDDQQQLWLGTHKGICKAAVTSLNGCAERGGPRINSVIYGRLDGLPSLECSGGYQPACWRARDGRLWFATAKGMVAIDPGKIKDNPVPPPVVIEELRIDGERNPLNHEPIIVAPGHKQFEFRFTGLSFIASDNVRFRYRLKGLEPDWEEAGTRRTVQYSHLGAGNYEFAVMACNNDGVWSPAGARIGFRVQPYFYQTWWFLGVSIAGILGLVAATVRSVITRKYRVAMAQLEQQHAIERDRARIAKDIHDDLGAGLTQITLISELARRDPPDQSGTHLDRISQSARQMTRSMDEIVWAVDPQHDTVSGLMDYVSAYTEDFLRTAGIRCRMDMPTELPPAQVDAESRYHVFLALKEALNNVVKHAGATEVWLRLKVEKENLSLVVEDNGQGLPGNGTVAKGQRIAVGHGLPNLEQRLAGVGGRCSVTSTAGQGTRVEFTISIRPLPSPIMARDIRGEEA